MTRSDLLQDFRRRLRGHAVAAALVATSGPSFADAQANLAEPATASKSVAPAYENDRGSWVFVPIPVANPTFGNGLQLGALYLHPPSNDGPPATSGMGAMATDNGTRLVAAFHDQSLMQDRFRVTAILAGGQLQAQFFGVGSGSVFAKNPVDYGFDGEAFALLGLARLVANANWFAGLAIQQAAATIHFDASDIAASLPAVQGKIRIVGGGPEVLYDSRDDETYPTDGEEITFRSFSYLGSWGNQPTFHKAEADFRFYRSISSTFVGAVRARLQGASDRTPFFALPSIDVRGVSSGRYRENRVISTSAELRYVLAERWGLLAFVDAGRAAASTSDLGSARTIVSYGGAVRWQPSAARRLYLGLNAAFSTDANAVFITVGETF
jgi:Omp85 superfamily domain